MSESRVLAIDIGRSAPLTFSSLEDATTWIDSEIAAWAWLSDSAVAKIKPITGTFQNTLTKRLAAIRSHIQNWPKDPDAVAAVNTAARGAFVDSRIPLTTDPVYQAIDELRKTAGPAAAASFAAAYTGTLMLQPQNVIPFVVIQGLVSAVAHEAKILPDTPRAVEAALEKVTSQFASRLSQATSEFGERQNEFRVLISSSEKRANDLIENIGNQWTAKLNEFSSAIDTSISSINATNSAYNEKMRLQAPVDYWAQKARDHRSASSKGRWWLIAYSVVASIMLIAGLIWLSLMAAEVARNEPAIYLKFVAVGAIATTILFWAGRVLLRIFLSERHLATDAEERVVMVMTYLALTNDGKIESSERPLVLGPLFKSAADGIVKEDSTPDTTLAAIVARGLDRGAPGR